MLKTMEQLTAGKTGKVRQELRNLIINFRQNDREIGAGMQEFLVYMDGLNLQQRQVDQQRTYWAAQARHCTDCGGVMKLHPVNTLPGNQVGGSHKSQWWCPKCDISFYNPQSVEDLVAEMQRVDYVKEVQEVVGAKVKTKR